MTTLLEVAGCVVGYLLVGLAWARSQAVRLQKLVNAAQDHRNEWQKKNGNAAGKRGLRPAEAKEYKRRDPWFLNPRFLRFPKSFEQVLRRGMVMHAAFWPGLVTARLVSKVTDWLTGPIEATRKEARGLRDQVNEYRKVADDPNVSEDDRKLFESIINDLLNQAKEREL